MLEFGAFNKHGERAWHSKLHHFGIYAKNQVIGENLDSRFKISAMYELAQLLAEFPLIQAIYFLAIDKRISKYKVLWVIWFSPQRNVAINKLSSCLEVALRQKTE